MILFSLCFRPTVISESRRREAMLKKIDDEGKSITTKSLRSATLKDLTIWLQDEDQFLGLYSSSSASSSSTSSTSSECHIRFVTFLLLATIASFTFIVVVTLWVTYKWDRNNKSIQTETCKMLYYGYMQEFHTIGSKGCCIFVTIYLGCSIYK